MEKPLRRSASEVIRNLEDRVARLEGNKTASPSKTLAEIISDLEQSVIAVNSKSDEVSFEQFKRQVRTSIHALHSFASKLSSEVNDHQQQTRIVSDKLKGLLSEIK